MLSASHTRVCAGTGHLAGTVAEDIGLERNVDAIERHCWDFHFDDPNCMSDSDWQLCGFKPGAADEFLCAAAAPVSDLLLGELRMPLGKVARSFIIRSGQMMWTCASPDDGTRKTGVKERAGHLDSFHGRFAAISRIFAGALVVRHAISFFEERAIAGGRA